MPRSSTITQADVNAICNRLTTAGVVPSVRKIQEEHGSGSQGTIYPMFDKWKLGEVQVPEVGMQLPSALQRVLLDFIKRETVQAKAGLEIELNEVKLIAADLARENERQANEIEQRDDEASTLKSGMSGLEARVDQLQKELTAAHHEANRVRDEAEKARTEVALALLRLEAMPRLDADLEAVRSLYEAERVARIAAERESAVAVAKANGFAERLADEKARNETSRAR